MASPVVAVGTGATITFATSVFTANILDIRLPGQTRKTLKSSHQATSTWHTFIPGKLVAAGVLEFDIQFNPDTKPIDPAGPTGPFEVTTSETISVVIPGATTPAQWAFSGYVTKYAPKTPLEDIQTATVTVAVTGAITIITGV